MIVKFNKNTGNFSYQVTAEVSDDLLNYYVTNGIVREIQGAPLGGWEKDIAYPGKGVKRPKEFTRTDIPFNDDNAEKLRKALMGLEVVTGKNEKDEPIKADAGITEVIVTEYTGPETKEPKFKAEKELMRTYLFEADGSTPRLLKSGGQRSAASFAESRGLTVPTEPWDEDTDFLAEVKAWQKAQAAAQD